MNLWVRFFSSCLLWSFITHAYAELGNSPPNQLDNFRTQRSGVEDANSLTQAMKRSEEESHDALNIDYKKINNDQEDFLKTNEKKTNPLTILRKQSH